MKTHTETIYFHIVSYPNQEPFYAVNNSKMESCHEYTILGEKEVSFAIPDPKVSTPMIIEGLQEKQKEMRATAAAAITEIDDQIASLLALPNHHAEVE